MPDMMMLPTQCDFQDDNAVKRITGYLTERIQASRERADCFKNSALTDGQNFVSKPHEWGYNWQMVEPITMESVNSTSENFWSSVFGKDRFFDIRAESGQDAVKVEKTRERVLKALRDAQWKLKYYNWGDDTIKFGRGEMATLACP